MAVNGGEIARNRPYRLHRDVTQLFGVVAPRPGVFRNEDFDGGNNRSEVRPCEMPLADRMVCYLASNVNGLGGLRSALAYCEVAFPSQLMVAA